MNFRKKKELASRTLKVGKGRIVFLKERKEEINQALTKQDIRDLYKEGAIIVKNVKGRKTKTKRKTRKRVGKIKKRVKQRKREYITITRKLRGYVKSLKQRGEISNDDFYKIRKKIRNREFKSLAQLKEQIKERK